MLLLGMLISYSTKGGQYKMTRGKIYRSRSITPQILFDFELLLRQINDLEWLFSFKWSKIFTYTSYLAAQVARRRPRTCLMVITGSTECLNLEKMGLRQRYFQSFFSQMTHMFKYPIYCSLKVRRPMCPLTLHVIRRSTRQCLQRDHLSLWIVIHLITPMENRYGLQVDWLAYWRFPKVWELENWNYFYWSHIPILF